GVPLGLGGEAPQGGLDAGRLQGPQEGRGVGGRQQGEHSGDAAGQVLEAGVGGDGSGQGGDERVTAVGHDDRPVVQRCLRVLVGQGVPFGAVQHVGSLLRGAGRGSAGCGQPVVLALEGVGRQFGPPAGAGQGRPVDVGAGDPCLGEGGVHAAPAALAAPEGADGGDGE